MCGIDSNEANSQAPPDTSHPAQNHNPASSPYAQMQDYISNVNNYKSVHVCTSWPVKKTDVFGSPTESSRVRNTQPDRVPEAYLTSADVAGTLREGEQFANAFFTTENKYVSRFFSFDER